MNTRSLYLRSGVFSLAAKAAAAPGALGVIWVINRIAGRETFGEIMIAYSLCFVLAAAIAAQFQTIVLYHVSRDHHAHTNKLGAALSYGLISGILAAIILTLLSPFIAASMHKPEMAPWFSFMAWIIPAYTLNSILCTWYRARQNIPVMVMYFEVWPLLSRLLFLLLILTFSTGERWIPAAYSFSYLSPFIILYLRDPVKLRISPRNFTLWDMRYSAQMMVSQFMSKSVGNIVLFLIGVFAPATVVADYTLAQKFAQIIQIPKQILSQIQMPRMGAQIEKQQTSELMNEFHATRALSLAAAISGTALFILFAPLIFNMFEDFHHAYGLFLILAMGAIIMAGFGSTGNYIGIAGYAGSGLLINAASLMFLAAAVFILVPLYGGIGAAVAATLGSFVLMLLMMLAIRRRDNLDTLKLSAAIQMALCIITLSLAAAAIIPGPAAALALITVAALGALQARPFLRVLLAA
jgi:O-antigen/teichoic acid export membrane protein